MYLPIWIELYKTFLTRLGQVFTNIWFLHTQKNGSRMIWKLKSPFGGGRRALWEGKYGLGRRRWHGVSKVPWSPDIKAQIHLASLTIQACLFLLPCKFAVTNLIYTYCSMSLSPFTGSPWLVVQTNECFPTQSLQLRLWGNLLGSYCSEHTQFLLRTD